MAPAEESQLYRDLMRLRPGELTPNAWAVKAGVNRTVWADMRRHGNPSRRTLEKLLAAAGSSLAEFEALRVEHGPTMPGPPAAEGVGDRPAGWRPAPLPPLPLFATAMAGEWGGAGSRIELTDLNREVALGQVDRPSSLAGDPEAYALTIIGDSMWPRFRPGRRIAVSPRSPIAIGDDVVVILAGGSGSGQKLLIKELAKRSASAIELRQFNPDMHFGVAAEDIAAMHKVSGELF